MKTKFVLMNRTEKSKSGETIFAYMSEDMGRVVKFHDHPTAPWTAVFVAVLNVPDDKLADIYDAYCAAGLKQHEAEGGFYEAIKTLEVDL